MRLVPIPARKHHVEQPGGEQDDGYCQSNGHSLIVTNAPDATAAPLSRNFRLEKADDPPERVGRCCCRNHPAYD